MRVTVAGCPGTGTKRWQGSPIRTLCAWGLVLAFILPGGFRGVEGLRAEDDGLPGADPLSGGRDVACIQAAYDALEKAYRRSLYEVTRPAKKDYRARLERWKRRAEKRHFSVLAEEIEAEMSALEKEMEAGKEALKGELKDVKSWDLEIESPPLGTGPHPVMADFRQALLEGGVIFDPESGSLRGWHEGRAQAELTLRGLGGGRHAIELDYSSIDRGRIKLSAGEARFTVALKDTGGFDKVETLRVGEYAASGSAVPITIGLPLHRSSEFVRIHGLRFVSVH